MSATYKAVTLDGLEHTGLDLYTLKQWYFARRIRPDSLILSTEIGEWKLLRNLFDPAQWEAEDRKTRGLGPNDSVFKDASAPQQLSRIPKPLTPYQYDRTNELGLRAAGILLLIDAAATIGMMAFLALAPTSTFHVSSFWGFAILVNIALGVNLLRSDNATLWKRIVLVLVCLGGFFGVVLMHFGTNQSARLIGLMEILSASSFLLLLLGEASRARVAAGVLTFVISAFGFVGVVMLNAVVGSTAGNSQILKYALPSRSFSDAPSGTKLDLPDGWVMLATDNPVAPNPEANLIAVHPDSDSFANLVIVKNSRGPNLDAALSSVVSEKRKSEPSVVEVERVNSLFGRLDGRKVVLTWQYKGRELKGEVTVARNGPYYIFLNQWCLAETYAKSRAQFAALENGAGADEPQPERSFVFPSANREP